MLVDDRLCQRLLAMSKPGDRTGKNPPVQSQPRPLGEGGNGEVSGILEYYILCRLSDALMLGSLKVSL
jgi:hypothetical protein